MSFSSISSFGPSPVYMELSFGPIRPARPVAFPVLSPSLYLSLGTLLIRTCEDRLSKEPRLCPRKVWSRLSKHRLINSDVVQAYCDKPWDWNVLSHNANVATLGCVKANPDKRWNWHAFGSNPKIATWDFVKAHRGTGMH
jgi:hypothetical protein